VNGCTGRLAREAYWEPPRSRLRPALYAEGKNGFSLFLTLLRGFANAIGQKGWAVRPPHVAGGVQRRGGLVDQQAFQRDQTGLPKSP